MKGIFILAGHSIYNPGANFKGLDERELNIKIVNGIRKQIQSPNIYYIGVDEDLSLQDKVKQVNKICKKLGYTIYNSLVLEIHINAGKGTGIEVLGYTEYMPFREIAFNIVESLCSSTGLKDRGIKNGEKFYIIKNTTPLAMIVECGFIDNNIDREILKNGIDKIIKGIVEGLGFNYKKQAMRITEYKGIPIEYKDMYFKKGIPNPNTNAQYIKKPAKIILYDAYFTRSKDMQEAILVHEYGHHLLYKAPYLYLKIWKLISGANKTFVKILNVFGITDGKVNGYTDKHGEKNISEDFCECNEFAHLRKLGDRRKFNTYTEFKIKCAVAFYKYLEEQKKPL